MKGTLAAVSAAALLGAGGLVGWYVFSRPDYTYKPDGKPGFDIAFSPKPMERPAVSPQPRIEPVITAVPAAPPTPAASPRPVAPADMQVVRAHAPAAPKAAPAAPAPNAAKTTRWALGHAALRALLRAPARVLAGQGPLKSPRGLRSFLDDKRAVEGYLNSPLVRAALKSPLVAKAVLSDPQLVGAFLDSPALRDPGAVRALLRSAMLRKILDCPGVQEALSDPDVTGAIAGDQRVAGWILRHPQAITALAAAAPALTDALPTGRIR